MQRPFSAFATHDQWRRARAESMTYEPRTRSMQLAWSAPDAASAAAAPVEATGLAIASTMHVYRSSPDGRVDRVLFLPIDLSRGRAPRIAEDFLVGVERPPAGDFVPAHSAVPGVDQPRGMAIDDDDRLYVASAATREVVVFDLWSQRLLRRVRMYGDAPPRGLVFADGAVFVAHGTDVITRVRLRHTPTRSRKPWLSAASRLAVLADGRLVALDRAGTADARLVFVDRDIELARVPWAGDVVADRDGALVVAGRPGDLLRRFAVDGVIASPLPPLDAPGYDGRGVVATPDGGVSYFDERGALEPALAVRVRHAQRGRVTTYRLDSGAFQSQWGRLFVDACIPQGTDLRAFFATSDEPHDDAALPALPPGPGAADAWTPPPIPDELAPPALDDPTALGAPLHRRGDREIPWTLPEDDAFATYEAPVDAPPGRYLWVTLDFTGDSRATPRVRHVRVEQSAHALVRRLPRTFSRDAGAASFLLRYLAPLEGLLNQLETASLVRHVLLDPHAAPAEALPWLASFVDLALDERWSLDVRRRMIAEAVPLFRRRGTVGGLTRLLQIVTGTRPVLLEGFMRRGGLAALGEKNAAAALGIDARAGGARPGHAHAHRFSVWVPASLDDEQRKMVTELVELHKPAHTAFDLCSGEPGFVVGRALYVEVTTAVGRSGCLRQTQLDAALLGRDTVIGRAREGAHLGATALGEGSVA